LLENRSIPRCTVIPELAYVDVTQAATWLCDAFGFTVRLRIANHRVQLNVGDGAMVVVERRSGEPSGAHAVMVRVADVNGHHARAVAHGARVLRPPTDYPYGERQYSVQDPGDHFWTFSQSIADVAPEEWGGKAEELI
jgi:uncharacterized glyoxalase superfamily protein PhnB